MKLNSTHPKIVPTDDDDALMRMFKLNHFSMKVNNVNEIEYNPHLKIVLIVDDGDDLKFDIVLTVYDNNIVKLDAPIS